MTDEIVNFPKKRGNANRAAEEQSRSHLFAATIARLAAVSTQEYERLRSKEAKAIECRPGVLDRLVARVRDVVSDARRRGNFKEEMPGTPGTMITIDGKPAFEVTRMRFSERHGSYYNGYDGGRVYVFCVAPDGEASSIVGWIADEP